MATKTIDAQGNILRYLDAVGADTVTDTRPITQIITAVAGEVFLDVAGEHTCAVNIAIGTSVTLVAEASIDGTNYFQLPIFNINTEVFLATITASGQFIFDIPAGSKRVRLRCTAISGNTTVAMRASKAMDFSYAKPIPTTLQVTATAAVSTGVTATLAAPGAGFYHYISRIRISKYVGATLTAAAAPSIVTSTNINGTPSFDFKTLGSLGDSEVLDIDFTGNPLKSNVANTATTVVAPVLTGAIWKISVFYYIGS